MLQLRVNTNSEQMEVSEQFWHISAYSHHVPQILVDQLQIQIANRFISETRVDKELNPSIERFYGALLFVDISGFTSLSTKLPVDELRVHINAYFHKIISIVDKYKGHVMKFAGDALYIAWQAPFQDIPGTDILLT
jgi:hypothetical protein